MKDGLSNFKNMIKTATGREALTREILAFNEQMAVAAAHHQLGAVQFGLCDFQTLSGKAEIIEIQLR